MINSIKAFSTKYYRKAAAHTLHTDIIVESWLILPIMEAHVEKISETSTILRLAVNPPPNK